MKKKCVICRKMFTGFGNNAEPVAVGKCCDECNDMKVLPARIQEFQEKIHNDLQNK